MPVAILDVDGVESGGRAAQLPPLCARPVGGGFAHGRLPAKADGASKRRRRNPMLHVLRHYLPLRKALLIA